MADEPPRLRRLSGALAWLNGAEVSGEHHKSGFFINGQPNWARLASIGIWLLLFAVLVDMRYTAVAQGQEIARHQVWMEQYQAWAEKQIQILDKIRAQLIVTTERLDELRADGKGNRNRGLRR